MINCKECKHWKQQCHGSDWGDCEELPKTKLIMASNIDGRADDFECWKDFGCVLVEKKE